MPIQACKSEGKPGYRWGTDPHAKCYTYTPGNEASRERAYEQARRQSIAIRINRAIRRATGRA